ncbi:RNA-binding domain-containing protein [Lentinus tigrinus ALCF2SS1-7]|uniref:RNA-binding domain-containing protein n=1 Tax=Lentinus tigrinus ALCF2SS1-6 TaxID=1328759 RepID=A0A5C2SWG5_9APHY|nr:RNA-binding domain-containing protein [Lentinus tigrinus ALCF2SS1-6]RPD79132.1 RNA-binding domain-containing protein [Lentinus tigrinus ALCF2SS1-7]
MTTLGKRKEREEGQEKSHGSTLFVSNLPYTATSTDLKTLFSDIAPVRTAFVVLEHGTGVSKGVGYVSFAIREDAAMAIDKISKEGIILDGRSLRVQWAGSKNKDHEHIEDAQEKPAKTPATRPHKPAGPSDPLAIRTVVISGLPAGIDSKTLWKKVRKLQGAEKVEWPIKAESGEEDASVAHATFETPATASEAVNKLHAHVFKGSLLSATLKKRLDGLAKAAAAKKAKAPTKPKAGPAPTHASRLIVRNLPFDITEQDLRAIFLPHGPIYSVHIPLASDVKHEDDVKPEEGESKPSRPRSKGFAFVWFLSRKDAEKAMEACNGMTVEAGMAETLVSDKQKKKKQRREEKKQKAQEGETAAGDEVEEEQEGPGKKRTIAVDWALSKDKWEAEKAKLEEKQGDGDIEMGEGSEEEDESGDESSSEESAESGNEDEEEQLGVHEDGSDESGESDSDREDESDEEDEDQKPAKPALPAPEVGTTVFVRNVPFEATDDELRTLFRAFGPLRYARITMDHDSCRSRGTGFVCFWNKEDADKAIEQSNILRAETVGNEPVVAKKNPFKMPSLLTPDPSASIAQNLVLHGRTLDVSRAVTRDEASKLKEAGERQREKADKRNLYLLREGIILPNTPAAESLPAAEIEKRTQSFNARRALLRSNPSLFVSRTRLSIRQLPLFVTERMLKRLAIHAIRAFESEVKAEKRESLNSDELAEPTPAEDDEDVKMEDDDEASHKKRKGKDRKGKGRNTGVKQAKVVRQQDRVDPVTGKGRSRGYGFLELGTHADALRVLRWANNNFAVGRLFEEWWKAELEDLIAAEKHKDAAKRDETRIKRIREEIEKGVPPKSRGTLIVEFSIENIQVVQRRATRTGADAGKDGKGGRQAKESKRANDAGSKKKASRRQSLLNIKREDTEGTEEQRPKKKRRVSDPPKPSAKSAKQAEEGASPSKAGKQVGSLIGRKRKERKMKKARGK